jgi:hypothetical protein
MRPQKLGLWAATGSNTLAYEIDFKKDYEEGDKFC